jgi:tRNA(Ile)-lysidine synthase
MERKAEFRDDKSNRDRRYLRNRIRWDLLPVLTKDYEPQLISRIGRLTELLRSEEELLDSLATQVEAAAILDREGQIHLDIRILSQQPKALQRRLIRRFLERLRGDLRGITFTDVETIRGLKEGKEFSLEEGLVLKRIQGIVRMKPSPKPPLTNATMWDGVSLLRFPELDLEVRGKAGSREESGSLSSDDQTLAVLDAGKLPFPLCVRSRRDGDRYRPLGAPGRAKLKEIFRAKGIPPDERDRKPVFLSGDEIVWVQGLPVAHKFRVTETTTSVFRIHISSLSK